LRGLTSDHTKHMGNPVKKVLEYRLDIDEQFQGWILIFASLTAVWIFCMPCYCAGLQSTSARRLAAWISLRLPQFYCFTILTNGLFMFLIVTWLPDWELGDYIKAVLTTLGWTVGHIAKFMDSIVLIVAAIIVFVFKERIAMIMGLDHTTLFRFKLRDCLNCFSSSRFQPIELTLWKVDDLPAADLLAANNIFVEVWGLGYNEGMKTRVHNNAGRACILKETMQINFDEGDSEDNMTIFIKHQGVMMGAGELARVELTADQVNEFLKKSKNVKHEAGLKWENDYFVNLKLNPRGTLYFRITPVEDETHHDGGGFYKDLTTC
jgi:hypothetical protein